MSETGLLILASREKSPGSIATLAFQAFEATAEVIWTSTVEGDVRLGVKFLSIEERGVQFLRGLSEYLRDQGYAP